MTTRAILSATGVSQLVFLYVARRTCLPSRPPTGISSQCPSAILCLHATMLPDPVVSLLAHLGGFLYIDLFMIAMSRQRVSAGILWLASRLECCQGSSRQFVNQAVAGCLIQRTSKICWCYVLLSECKSALAGFSQAS